MTIKRLVVYAIAACILIAAGLGCSLLPSESNHSPSGHALQITIK